MGRGRGEGKREEKAHEEEEVSSSSTLSEEVKFRVKVVFASRALRMGVKGRMEETRMGLEREKLMVGGRKKKAEGEFEAILKLEENKERTRSPAR